ncbi:MAG: glycerate kinase [Ktedonobacterales bacterium]|nr:glycerate kinase [Ktedonobacterales bacterium]
MKIVVAPQALKGSLDAEEVGHAIARGISAALPVAAITLLPVADGGEGTVRALVAATGGHLRTRGVTGPLGSPVTAEYGLLGTGPPLAAGRVAVIEMAAASGLPLVPPERRNPLMTTTRGTGELMRAALDAGCETLLIAIGGSATNDGGAGMAQALGAHLLDDNGDELPPGGAALARLAHIELTDLDPRLAAVHIQVACDVTNPLLGPRGASVVYGPQKGATPAMVAELDRALAHYADVLRRDLGVDMADVAGAGAAGGLGAGLLAFAQAELVPGARLVLEALGFEAKIRGARLVFTAEGRLDGQTAYGKAVGAVAAAARRQGARVVALVGQVALGATALAALGIDAALPLADGPLSLEESMSRAPELVAAAAERAMRLILMGEEMARA